MIFPPPEMSVNPYQFTACFLYTAFLDAYLFRHLVPGDASLLVTERLIHELDVNGHVVIQNIRHVLAILLGEFRREGDFEVLMHGLVRWQAVVKDDAALFIGAAAHFVATAELLGNRHVDL